MSIPFLRGNSFVVFVVKSLNGRVVSIEEGGLFIAVVLREER